MGRFYVKKLVYFCLFVFVLTLIIHIPREAINYADSSRKYSLRKWNATSQHGRGGGISGAGRATDKQKRAKTTRPRWQYERESGHLRGPPVRLCTPEERVQHVSQFCKTIRRQYTPHEKTLSDPYHRLIYCPIPRVASVSFEYMFKRAAERRTGRKIHAWIHNPDAFSAHNLSYFSHLTRAEIQKRLSEYRGFLVVRHPFSRLYSAYRNGAYRSASWRRGIPAPRWPGFNASGSDRVGGGSVPDFREFLVWSSTRPRFDRRFDVYQTQCRPCAVDWDLIFRTETIDRESGRILELFAGDLNAVPHLRRTEPPDRRSGTRRNRRRRRRNKSESPFQQHIPQFAGLPRQHLDRLLAIYGTDMRMFGYHWDDHTNTASCHIETAAGDLCC